ncbi:hypothetical protein QQ056_06640 [Oscillatoria laete-virens NRMC-F 0139]|nr:hypothetical protein [Oscillatoria laete-virens]MDL5053220.1 hypothetical protein [Oscillatoria laete-virens NRMC-F 0139]
MAIGNRAHSLKMKRLTLITTTVLLFILSAKAAIQVKTEGASISDVKKVEHSLNAVDNTAKSFFGNDYAELKAGIECEVIVHGYETEKANTGRATLESSARDGKLYATLHILAPSKYGEGLKSMGGQDKGSEEYTLRLLGHEILSLYLEALSRTRPKGWAYYSAPSWFTQGSQEYVGSLCLEEKPRREIFENYFHSATVHVDPEITVSNPYSGGLVIMQFIAEEYGENKILKIITSEAATFDDAFHDVLGSRSEFQKAFQTWEMRKRKR